jgi:hypothetical protein
MRPARAQPFSGDFEGFQGFAAAFPIRSQPGWIPRRRLHAWRQSNDFKRSSAQSWHFAAFRCVRTLTLTYDGTAFGAAPHG